MRPAMVGSSMRPPTINEEFDESQGILMAATESPAYGQMDLLTVQLHEIGHLLGLSHEDKGLMAESLDAGVRHLPEVHEDNLLANGTPDTEDGITGSGSGSRSLTEIEPQILEDTLAAAIAIWEQTGRLSDAQRTFLGTVDLQVADLEGSTLATAEDSTIKVDVNAAGHGWFIDDTPSSSEEFVVAADGTLTAAEGSVSEGQMDLLTVLLHEIGHLLDMNHQEKGLMAESLYAGTRYLPEQETSLASATADEGDPDDVKITETRGKPHTPPTPKGRSKPQPFSLGLGLLDPLLNLLRRK